MTLWQKGQKIFALSVSEALGSHGHCLVPWLPTAAEDREPSCCAVFTAAPKPSEGRWLLPLW